MRRAVLLIVVMTTSFPGLPTRANAKVVESHCVIDVVGQLASGELIVSEASCYATLAEAIFDASDGAVRLNDNVDGRELFGPGDTSRMLSSFTLGIHFDGANGSGSSITVTGAACSGGYWNTGSAWANRISSSYNGCGRLAHYDLANKGGSVENTFGAGTTDNLGALDNRTESVAYYSS